MDQYASCKTKLRSIAETINQIQTQLNAILGSVQHQLENIQNELKKLYSMVSNIPLYLWLQPVYSTTSNENVFVKRNKLVWKMRKLQVYENVIRKHDEVCCWNVVLNEKTGDENFVGSFGVFERKCKKVCEK